MKRRFQWESQLGLPCVTGALDTALAPREVRDRFWSKVRITKPTKCWLWQGAVDSPGYGAFKFQGKKRNSHRVAFELSNGAIPEDMDVMHDCDRRLCCNPSHLRAAPRQANVADMDRKGRRRSLCGEKRANARLTEDAVRKIRELYINTSRTTRELERIYGIDRRAIQKLLRGINWGHVPFDPGYHERYKAVAKAKRRRRPLSASVPASEREAD